VIGTYNNPILKNPSYKLSRLTLNYYPGIVKSEKHYSSTKLAINPTIFDILLGLSMSISD